MLREARCEADHAIMYHSAQQHPVPDLESLTLANPSFQVLLDTTYHGLRLVIVLKEPYFLLYQSKLNITGYCLFPISPQGSRKSKKLACSTVWYYQCLSLHTHHTLYLIEEYSEYYLWSE